MANSFFLTPSFILVELGFFICTLLAAYECFVGDFIWAKEEEERQTTQKARRPFQSKSLSPRGRSGRPLGPGDNEDETMPLLHGRRFAKRWNESATSEEESFPSPGEMRSVDIGRGTRGGSSGDSTRRVFYKLIILSLLSRLLLIPVEFYCFGQLKQENNIPLRILLRMSQTLPHIAFASSLGLLVIFCAQVSFAALPPLSPSSIDGSDEEEIIPTHEVTQRDSLEEKIEEESPINRKRSPPVNRKINTNCASKIHRPVSRFFRAILASKQTFPLWNFFVLISYSAIFLLLSAKNGTPISQAEIYIWFLLTAIYVTLLAALLYVGMLLLKALSPGFKRRKDSNALAVRLLATCMLLAAIFIERIVNFAIAAHSAVVYDDSYDHGERKLFSYRRDAMDYGVTELLPVFCLLFMMHRRRRGEMPSDIIMNSFIHSVFGSVLSTEEDGDVGDVGSAEGGAMNPRKFQTYGGSRLDSFPPGSNRGRSGGIGRAASSSGQPKLPRS